MSKVIGITLAAIVVAVVSIWFVSAGCGDFAERLPPVFHRGVRVEYVQGAEEWEGLRAAIDALHTSNGQHNGHISRIVITVYPPNAEISGMELNGTMELDSAPFGRDFIFIKVRQLADSKGVRNACVSAIHHEFIEHAVPLLEDGDPNFGHGRPDLTTISLSMTRECQALLSQQP